jgi:dihydrolipoamide dehydrogenase
MAEATPFDVVVIGGGPGGYTAAARAAELGLKTACVERRPRLGGVCLNVGCIPSKALLDSSEFYHLARTGFAEHGIRVGEPTIDIARMMARKDRVVGELTENVRKLLESRKVEVVAGTATLAAADRVEVAGETPRTLAAKNVILATGSEPVALPGTPFDGSRVVSSTEALALEAVPGRLGVVGGGYIGLELGSVWQRLGAKVTVLEMLPDIATALDGQVGRRLLRVLKKQGIEIRLETRVASARVEGEEVVVDTEAGGKAETLRFDRLLVSVGRRPLTTGLGLEALGIETVPPTGFVRVDAALRTRIPTVYAIGDLVEGPMLAHKASAEGIAAAETIAGRPGEVNYDAIPAVIYTAPEVAGVGPTEESLKSRGVPYAVGAYPFTGSGRAKCYGDTEGFVKVLAHKKTDRLLAVHIIGPHAADVIAEAVLAIELGAAAEDLARTVHGHPTFGEALMEAAAALRR